MTDQEAVREVSWVAKQARRILLGELTHEETIEFYERKRALLDHIAGTQDDAEERADTLELAAAAQAKVDQLTAGYAV